MEVHGRLAPGRAVGADDFADITAAAVISADFAPGGLLRVVFASDLTDDERWLVEQRITAHSDTEEQRRVALWRAAKKGASNLAAMHIAYTLDLPMPEPVYTTTTTAQQQPTVGVTVTTRSTKR